MTSNTNSGAGALRPDLVAAAMGLAQDAVAAETTAALTSAGIRSLVLKGPAVIRWLYPEVTDRYSVDVDLLVSPDDVDRAEVVLEGLGFMADEPKRDDRHSWGLTRPVDGRGIDLHHRLVGVGVSDERAWDIFSADTETQEVGGRLVEVLAPGARALHLALHAAQELQNKSKAMRDLERGLDVLSPGIWRDARTVAARLDADPAFAAGLRLVSAGRALAASLKLPEEVTAEVALRSGTPPDLSLGLNTLLDLPGRRRIAYAAMRAFPPPGAMRAWSPLARKGRTGLAAGYVWRAAWLASRLGPAIRAVRRARAAGRRPKHP